MWNQMGRISRADYLIFCLLYNFWKTWQLIPIKMYFQNVTGLLQSILAIEFILALAVDILSFTLPISRQLQYPGLDLTKCIEIILTVLDVLKNKRQNAIFNIFLPGPYLKLKNLNIKVKTTRICKRQTNRSNNITEEYFIMTIYHTVLDNFLTSNQSIFFDN